MKSGKPATFLGEETVRAGALAEGWHATSALRPFAAALLMHGDVGHTLDDSRFPHDFTFGLIEGGNRLPDGSGWQALLAGRPLMPPTPLGHGWSPIGPPTTRISGGDGTVGSVRRGQTW